MKLLPFLLLISAASYGQKIERFYDYFWKETRTGPLYYAVLEQHDSGWRRHVYYLPEGNMFSEGYFEDSTAKTAEGTYLEFYRNKSLRIKGTYLEGKKHGAWLRYHSNGMIADSTTWMDGKRKGISLGWSATGILSDSSVYDGEGNVVSVGWYDSGAPRSAGRYVEDTLMAGKWIFYHPNGKPSAQQVYERGKRVSQQYFNEDGSAVSDTANTDREASFPGKTAGWRKYLERNMNPMVPANLGAPNGMFTVAVRFVVNTDGTLESLDPLTSHGYGMEEEVLRLLRKSPSWEPARMYNRLVKAYRIQPVTFVIQGK